MRALLLAAGFGTRLRPLTDKIPKCLVPIKGKPLLGIWIDGLISCGVKPILINTHYFANQVNEFVALHPSRDFLQTTFEKELLGTGGTLLRNIDFFNGEDGLLVHADNYCLADLGEFIRAHKQRPPYCLMTMMTFETKTPRSCGIVELNDKGIVIGFHEKVDNPPGNLANGAVYILSAELLREIKTNLNHVSDLSTEIIPLYIGKIYSWKANGKFMDIGTPEAYQTANE